MRGSRISLRADADRRLEVADPTGREMMISCGAALATLCLALRALGHRPEAVVLPDPDRPHLVADVHLGGPAVLGDDGDARRLFAQVEKRRTHRGGFGDQPVGAPVLATLHQEAEAEGARLVQAVEMHTKGALAALTQAADHLQRRSQAQVGETARWAPAPGSARTEGVPQEAYPRDVPRTEPYFPQRDFARGHGWGVPGEPPDDRLRTGAVFLLVTGADEPRDWIRAGQALQRVLLRATEAGLSAAFHTQALEIPELRAFIRARICPGTHPQMLLRLGTADDAGFTTVRRAPDVTQEG
ncbi:Acg family FMN-binding oxidoreductase [Actinomadura kijaniata]|uniref:Acg family FMN-binding oxidoreductase n=1 Tax=Actinomadura kijaniata TaxID=46161 RepID=UPI003F195F62